MSNIAFWTAASGMRAYQNSMDVTAHNIANVNTNGYKAQRPAFDALLRSRINTNVEGQHMVGHGVKQEYVDQLMGQGTLNQTGYALDFALTGDGFFAVDNNGERQYTRNGAFDLSVEGNSATLVTNDGAYVLDTNGNRIIMPVSADGSVETEGVIDRLGVYNFPNAYGLQPRNNSCFVQSENSGVPTQVGQTEVNGKKNTILQHTLEFSGVDLGSEMIEVINSQRAFQVNSRVVQTADQMDELLNNLR